LNWKDDPQTAAVGQVHTLTEATLFTQSVEHPTDGPRVLSDLSPITLEAIDLLDHLDGE
jgi:hypothetical protein